MASLRAKKANHDDGSLDRISNLPDSILSRILSSLHIYDAVSTSVLSTRWRYLFTSMFNLLGVGFYSYHPPDTLKMLFLHTEGRIEKFELDNIDISKTDSTRVLGWISAAVWRGVKDLYLNFNHIYTSNNTLMMHLTVLFFSTTLVRLKLEFPFLMAVPINVCLPSLKFLELHYIEFEDDDSVKRLISSCRILEDLSLFKCNLENIKCLIMSNPSLKSLTLEFDCIDYDLVDCQYLPGLVYFKYVGFFAVNYSVVNTPSLVRADINISAGYFIRAEDNYQHSLVRLFEGIGNVKSLHLTIHPQALPILSHKRYAAFEKLVQLEIDERELEWDGIGLFEFLEFSPNLQTLVIWRLPNEVSVPTSCLLYQLKEIEFVLYHAESGLFKTVTYILRNARVLEKLEICSDPMKL